MLRAAAWLVPLLAYALSAYRTVGFWDVGEMDVRPWMFHVVHPPGMPLYVLIGWIWSHGCAVGSVAWRMSMLSAVAMSFAAWCLARITYDLCGDELAACASSLLFAFGNVAWAVGTRADVHAVETAAFACAMWLWLRWFRTRTQAALDLAAFAFGLAIAIHPVGVWMLGGILVLLSARLHDLEWPSLLRAGAIGSVTALLPYAFVPHDVVLAGDVRLRGAFAGVPAFALTLYREEGGALALSFAGLVLAAKARDLRIAALVVAGVGSTIFALGFPEESDLSRYYLPLFAALAVCAGYALSFARRPLPRALAASLAALVVAWLLVAGRGFFHQPYDTRALDQSEMVLHATSSDAVLIATWVLAPTLEYRRDVDRALGGRILVSSWYGDVEDELPGWMAHRSVYVVGTPEGSITGYRLERLAAQTELYRVERTSSKP